MYPILLQLGPITIYSLWIFIAIGFFAALLIINKLVKKNRLGLVFLAEHSLAIFFAGLAVSRIFFIIKNYSLYLSDFDIGKLLQFFYIWDKGLSVAGGIIGIVLSLFYFCRKEKENFLKWTDILSVSILGALVFGNIGAFLDGRNYGIETSLPWGMIFENSIYTVPIHPTQLYAAIYCAIIAFTLFRLFNSKFFHTEGNLTLIAIISYSTMRFLEEFVRGDESNIILGLREQQIYTLLIMAISAILFFVRKKIIKHNP